MRLSFVGTWVRIPHSPLCINDEKRKTENLKKKKPLLSGRTKEVFLQLRSSMEC